MGLRANRTATTAPAAPAPIGPLTRDFLHWLARCPRSYAETMEAWRSSCPRLTVWEDAVADGLVREESGDGGRLSDVRIVLTPRGRAALAGD